MKNERDSRRRQILDELRRSELTATIYRASTNQKNDILRRRACLEALVADIARDGHTKLCLGSDQTMDERDRRDLAMFTRTYRCNETLIYLHERAASEPLLAVPDAIGWAWSRGRDWRARSDPLVDRVIDV